MYIYVCKYRYAETTDSTPQGAIHGLTKCGFNAMGCSVRADVFVFGRGTPL